MLEPAEASGALGGRGGIREPAGLGLAIPPGYGIYEGPVEGLTMSPLLPIPVWSWSLALAGPAATDVALSPAHPWLDDVVACAYTFVAEEGAADRSEITWRINGVEVDSGTTLGVPFEVGDVLQCEVLPSDGVEVGPVASSEAARVGTNVLILLIDDLGIDKLGLYGLGTRTPPTPTIDRLAARGVVFERAYAEPMCSPTRAAIQTGRLSHRHGVGYPLAPDDDWALMYEEETLAERVEAGTDGLYDNAYVGKWHLSTIDHDVLDHVNLQGWYGYSGSLYGVSAASYTFDGRLQTWYDWERVEDGVPARSTTYLTTSNVDDALMRVATMSEPWLMEIGFNNVHKPFHLPPPWLHGDRAIGKGDVKLFHWMLEALDTEMGRLLRGIPPDVLARTTVVLLGDNGTVDEVVEPIFDRTRQKGTVYEGGVHVPMIVVSPLVVEPGRSVDHLVHAVDVFATVAEITGAGLNPEVELDAVSFLSVLTDPDAPPVRDTVSSSLFRPPGLGAPLWLEQMVRNDAYKLILHDDGTEELYDLREDRVEGEDLLSAGPLSPEALAAYEALLDALP